MIDEQTIKERIISDLDLYIGNILQNQRERIEDHYSSQIASIIHRINKMESDTTVLNGTKFLNKDKVLNILKREL